MKIPTYIKNHQAVVEFFGRWPSFHDANVVAYEREPESESIGLTVHTWLMTDKLDAKGFFVLRNHALVSFRFGGVYAAGMDAFGTGNILYSLEISPCPDPASFQVALESVMDMSGSFSAHSGEVVSLTPCASDAKTHS